MKVIIPSLNRACQLDLLIRSMEENLPNIDFDMDVLWKRSTLDYFDAYQKMANQKRRSKVTLFPELIFKENFRYLVSQCKDRYVMLLTDDCAVYNYSNVSEQEILRQIDDKTWCFSLRLGLNTTTQWYVTEQQQQELGILGYESYANRFIKWNWKIRPPFENYGYAFSWDGHLYFKEDLLGLIDAVDFYNPRTFEDRLTKKPSIRQCIDKKYMASFKESLLFVNSINAVQSEPPLNGTLYYYSPEDLNKLYLEGKRISMKSFDNLSLTGSHDEIPLIFEEDNA